MKILELVKNADFNFKKHLSFFLISYFLVLFNYSLVRASSSALFFDTVGAKSSPLAWLWAVIFLTFAIYVCNKLQTVCSVQKVFLLVSVFSALLILASTLGIKTGAGLAAFVPFIWKEIYIVIQIHLLLAYANSHYEKDVFKILIGPIGAVGSIGGIVGGLATRYISGVSGTYMVMWVGLIMIAMPALFFLQTPALLKDSAPTEKSPLATLTPSIRKYVGIIAAMVALTQFIINIADFNFNVAFAALVTDSSERTSYLGDVSTVINGLTFIFQFICLPLVLPRVSERNYHLLIPLSYLVGTIALMGTNAAGIIPIATFYVYLKACDYSIFSGGKELLYQPLQSGQKYGAKYLTDMLVYRAAKALIAVVLIYLQSSIILNTMMVIFLVLWVILIIELFKLHRQLFNY